MPTDIVEMLQHFVVPETQDAEAFGAKEGVAVEVPSIVAVLATVDFDNKLRFEADEIEDVAAERDLAAEFCAGELAITQRSPEAGFRRGRVGAHLACPGSSEGFGFVAHGIGLLDWASMRLWVVVARCQLGCANGTDPLTCEI